MSPNVTLHWFTHPQWFHELGEFQVEENIPLFVAWAETAFKLFGMPKCMQALRFLVWQSQIAFEGFPFLSRYIQCMQLMQTITSGSECRFEVDICLCKSCEGSRLDQAHHCLSGVHRDTSMLRPAIIAGEQAQLWTTFNEPAVASLCGHIMGNHPPGKVMHFKEGGMKLCTMLRAHTAAYKAIKNLPGKFCTCVKHVTCMTRSGPCMSQC